MKKGVEEIKETWNWHYVRKSRYYTQAGIPNQLFLLPETMGTNNYKKEHNEQDLFKIEDTVNPSIENDSHYQEYFSYSAGVLGLGQIQTWRQTLTAYERLLQAA